MLKWMELGLLHLAQWLRQRRISRGARPHPYVDDPHAFSACIMSALGIDPHAEVVSLQLNIGVDEIAKLTIEKYLTMDETELVIRTLKDFEMAEKMTAADEIERLRGEVRLERTLREFAVDSQERTERVFLGIPEPTDA